MLPSRIATLISSTASHRLLSILWQGGYKAFMSNSYPLSRLGSSTVRYCFSAEEAVKNEGEKREFSDFITDQGILSRLQKNGITKMFPIQEETFKFIESGLDVLASDRTGSGKTLGYTLPILEKFNKAKYNLSPIKTPKFLILCPTRELVLQVTNEITKVTSAYKVVSVYGGSAIDKQINEINRGIAIVVATPGRLIDLLERKALNLKDLEAVCIDEADTMLEKGFKDDVEEIFNYVRNSAGKTQNIMFSATIPTWVSKIAREYFDKNMKRVSMVKDADNRTSETVDHYALYVKRSARHKTVQNLIQKYNPNNRTIIFTQMKAEANDFIKEFDNNEIVILHGDIPQNVREINMNHFRSGHKKILIATDIAARGIDIPDVELIIQLSPPENPEQYIHRSGRTGRAGKEGVNITFFDESNISDLIQTQKSANINIKIISDNHNITFWKNKIKGLVHRVSEYQPANEDVYKKFAEEILRNTTPEKALLYFLKQDIGKLPETTSILTNKKGFISYIAYPNQGKSSVLSEVFGGIVVHNEVTDSDGIKFDITANDFYQFEERIEKQEDFEVEPLDENKKMTLSIYSRKLMRKPTSDYGNRGDRYSDNRNRDSRFGGSSRQDRPERSERSDRPDRSDKYERQDRQERQERPNRREGDAPIPEGLSVYRVFLYGFSPEVQDREMKESIAAQAQVTNFKLKVLKKTDDDGKVKTFGFIEFPQRQDCVKFMASQVNVNGEQLKKRLAQQRR